MTDIVYADDQPLLINTSAQAESLLPDMEQAARGVGIYVNSEKIELIYSKQNETIFILSGKVLKLIDQFTCLGSNISSTEGDIRIRKA